MTADLIRANIITDTTSWTAQYYFTNYNIGGYSSPGQIPRYLYTCLADLCSSFGTFPNLVVADYGLAETPSSAAIIIQPTTIQDSIRAGWLKNDQPGAEYGEFNILVKNVRTSKDINLTKDIGLRLRLILDYKLRSIETNQFQLAQGLNSPDLIITGDNNVDPNGYYKTEWKGSGVIRVGQQAHAYCAEYVRNFNFDYGSIQPETWA